MNTMSTPLGSLVDLLGISHRAAPGQTVCGAVVLLKIVDADGSVMLGAEWSPELSWLERVGMLREADRAEHVRHQDL
jgi:hypothetical protein